VGYQYSPYTHIIMRLFLVFSTTHDWNPLAS
jgi:hypothetical protein